MKRRRTRTRLQLVPETTGGRLVCGKELLFSWRCSHSRFTRETSSLPCFRYRILPSRQAVNTGNPIRWEERSQPEFREEQSGPHPVAERSAAATTRTRLVEPTDL